MKLGAVLKKERERSALPLEDAASELGISTAVYEEIEEGKSTIEDWAPKLAEIAIKLSTPTARLISHSGKATDARSDNGQCGELVKMHREKKGLSPEELAARLGWSPEQLTTIEGGSSPIEQYGPLMLRFAEMIHQPIFNLFYPCGLPFTELTDYP